MLEDLSYSPIVAAATLGLLPEISIAGRFSYKFLALKFKARDTACVILGSMLIGILTNATALPLVYTYVVLFVFSYDLLLVTYPDQLITSYGRTIYPQLVRWVGLLHCITTTGPWLSGTIRDATGGYVPAFIVVAIFLAFGLACSTSAKIRHVAGPG